MTTWGIILLVVGGIFWFLAGSSTNGQPTLGPIYGGLWQTVFMLVGLLGLILVIVGLVKKKPSATAPAEPEPPAEEKKEEK